MTLGCHLSLEVVQLRISCAEPLSFTEALSNPRHGQVTHWMYLQKIVDLIFQIF